MTLKGPANIGAYANAVGGKRRRAGSDASEAAWVAERRRAGVGWQAIAQMLGRSVEDVRRAYDKGRG